MNEGMLMGHVNSSIYTHDKKARIDIHSDVWDSGTCAHRLQGSDPKNYCTLEDTLPALDEQEYELFTKLVLRAAKAYNLGMFESRKEQADNFVNNRVLGINKKIGNVIVVVTTIETIRGRISTITQNNGEPTQY